MYYDDAQCQALRYNIFGDKELTPEIDLFHLLCVYSCCLV